MRLLLKLQPMVKVTGLIAAANTDRLAGGKEPRGLAHRNTPFKGLVNPHSLYELYRGFFIRKVINVRQLLEKLLQLVYLAQDLGFGNQDTPGILEHYLEEGRSFPEALCILPVDRV